MERNVYNQLQWAIKEAVQDLPVIDRIPETKKKQHVEFSEIHSNYKYKQPLKKTLANNCSHDSNASMEVGSGANC